MTQDATNASSLVPTYQPEDIRHRRRIANWATEVNKGNIQNTGSVTLVANAGTTTVTESRAGPNSFIGFMPLTANALSAEPTVYVSSQGKGTFTITHGNTASVDKTFRYCLLGV